MSQVQEFHYRLPRRLGGRRPGAHAATSLGSGQEFVAHASLYHRPDPRRLDLRASLRDPRGDWLVRVDRQRAGATVHVVVDCSSSMRFGATRPKLHVVADFVEALGHSSFRLGDALGMIAFDAVERGEFFMPALLNRGAGTLMAAMLRGFAGEAAGAEGVAEAAMRLAGREGLVFLASDFHWPLERLGAALDLFAPAYVVPLVVWDPAEIEPPAHDGLAVLRDVESGVRRTLWLRPKLRARWREAVAARRAELDRFFDARGLRPFYLSERFDAEAMSRYFFEAVA